MLVRTIVVEDTRVVAEVLVSVVVGPVTDEVEMEIEMDVTVVLFEMPSK